MTDQTGTAQVNSKPMEFKGSLVRTVVIFLLIISIVPALIVGASVYSQSQNVLRDQTTSQLGAITESYIEQINNALGMNVIALHDIREYNYLPSYLRRLLKDPSDPDFIFAQDVLSDYLNKTVQSSQTFNMISIYDFSGNLLASSDISAAQEFFRTEETYNKILGTEQSILAFDPGGLFSDQMVFVSVSTLSLNNEPVASVVGYSVTPIPLSILQASRSVLSSSRAYLVSADGSFVTDFPNATGLLAGSLSTSQEEMLSQYIDESPTGAGFEYNNVANEPVFSYIQQIPNLNAAFILEVPSDSVFGEIESVLPSVILLMAAVLLTSAAIVAILARRMVMPLVDLSASAQGFAAGDWSFRAEVNRRDEIGLLAYSFNKMVDELTNYYYSLETRVEEKTRQLRIAAEIAQEAVAFANRSEILLSIPKLIVEKLEIPYAAIYQFNPLQKTAKLSANASKEGIAPLPENGLSVSADNNSLVGWACLNKQSRVSDDLALEKSLSNNSGLITTARAQIVVPIIVDNTLVAILDFQSQQPDAFDQESVSIFTSFAEQIASGIRNIQVLENAQIDLREKTSLYQISRDLSQAKSVDEVKAGIVQFFEQTDLVGIFLKCENDQVKLLSITDPQGTKVDQSLIGFNIPLAKGLPRLRENNVVILDNLKAPSDLSNLAVYFDKRNCSSIAVLPITESGELRHILAIGSRASEPISNLQVQPYRNFCEVIGTTLERIDLLEQLNLRVQELSAIASVGEAASTASDLGELFENLFSRIKEALGEDIGFAVALNNNENSKVYIPFYYDEEKFEIPEYPYSNDLISQTILTGSTILHRDANAIGLFSVDSPEKRVPTRSFLGIPLIVGSETVGALALLHRRDANRFNDSNLGLLTTLAPQISTSIKNVELLESQRSAINAYDKERFLLNSLLKNIPDKVSIKDTEGKLIRVSSSYAESMNITNPDLLIGQEDVTAKDSEIDGQDPDLSVLASGSPLLGEIEQHATKDGRDQWFLTSKIPLISQDGTSKSLLKISRDITELISTQHIAEHRSEQLVIASEVAREASTGTMHIDEMLTKMVNMIKTRFGFYHSSIFMVDPVGQYAILRESTGEAGAKLKEAKHKLAVGSSSIVGQATGRVEPVVVNDVTKEKNYYPNPLLPDTRSELAIPLRIGEKLIGALDVQSQQVDAFTQEDVSILQIMADQLSVAIENAELFSKTQQTLERHRLLHQVTASAGQSITIADAIRNAVQTVHLAMPDEQVGFLTVDEEGTGMVLSYAGYSASEVSEFQIRSSESIYRSVIRTRQPVRIDDINAVRTVKPIGLSARSVLSVPVYFGNKIYGVINVESNNPGVFDESDQEIITTLGNNLASIIANIELVEQITRQVERQRQLYDITSKIRKSVDFETIMQTSLAEVCNALNIRRGSIQLSSPSLSTISEQSGQDEKEIGK